MADGKPGAPVGNNNGGKGRRWAQAIERALAHKYGTTDDGLREIASVIVKAAAAGDTVAWKEIGDRVDGKPQQAIVGASDAEPIQIVITATQANL